MRMDQLPHSNKIKSFVIILEGIVLLALILYLGKPLFIPLAFAFLISFILYPICHWLENHGINRNLAIGLPIVLMVVLFTGIGYLLMAFLLEHFHEMGDIKPKLLEVLHSIHLFLAENLGLSTELQNEITQNSKAINIESVSQLKDSVLMLKGKSPILFLGNKSL